MNKHLRTRLERRNPKAAEWQAAVRRQVIESRPVEWVRAETRAWNVLEGRR